MLSVRSSHRRKASVLAARFASLVTVQFGVARATPPPAADVPGARPQEVAPPPAEVAPVKVEQARPAEAPRKGEEVLLLRTVVVGAFEAGPEGQANRREFSAGAHAERLDLTLSDAIQDLGLTLDLSERAQQESRELADIDVVARAAKGTRWLIYPTIDARGGDLLVRLAVVAPGSKVAFVRTESVKPAELAVRAVVMLRDAIATRSPTAGTDHSLRRSDRSEPPSSLAVRARSQGRATLVFNGALFGGFVGYSVQRGSGSDDPRLLFPLLALGTGLGLGASAIVAEEWDVGLGDAWYLSAAAWWPALSGLFLARSRHDGGPSSEYGFALIGALSGLGLATTSLAIGGGMSEGGALLTHSGGAFGLVLGGMTELAIHDVDQRAAPNRGLGYGTAAGVLLAGAAATRLELEPSRVLLIDLGAGLGGLAGAAATSPFIFQDPTPAGYRAFLLTTMGSTVAGGIAAWYWTRKAPPSRTTSALVTPYAGIIAETPTAEGTIHAIGVGVSGLLP